MKSSKYSEKLLKEGRKTAKYFSSLKPEEYEVEIYNGDNSWLVKDVLAHIVSTERGLLSLFKSVVEDGKGTPADFSIDEYNNLQVIKMKLFSPNSLIDQFINMRNEISSWVNQLSENDFLKVGRHPGLGKTRLGDMIKMIYLHINLHIRDIDKSLNRFPEK